MAADWDTFKSNMKDFMVNMKATDINNSADKISTEYDKAVSTATTVNKNKITGGDKSLIKSAFETSMNLIIKSPIDLGIKPYTIMASGIIGYWKNVKINPLPPVPPDISATTGFTINFFGLPVPLDQGLQKALNSGIDITDLNEAVDLVLTNLVLAFSTHMKLISGVYNGMIAGPPPIAGPPIPFTGII